MRVQNIRLKLAPPEGGTTIEVASKVGEGRGTTLKRRGSVRAGRKLGKKDEAISTPGDQTKSDQGPAWPPVSLLV